MRSRLVIVVLLLIAKQSLSVAETPVALELLSKPAQQKPSPGKKAPLTDQQRLLQQKCAELDRLQHEISQLRAATGTPQQILVKVQLLEVALTKMRSHGIDTEWFANAHLLESPADLQQVFDSARAYTQSAADDPQVKSPNESLQFVDWLRKQNLAKPLAEPTLVVMSGKPASMHVGGEFPVPLTSDAKEAVGFRQFGTQLDVVALAMGDNRVSLNIKARVSDLDTSNAIEMNGIRIPGLRVRECDTGSELPFGHSVVLTGLVQKRVEALVRTDGQVIEEAVDVGLMVVVTPELAESADTPSAKVSHAVQGAAYR